MDIQHEGSDKGEFYIEREGKRIAKLQYLHQQSGEINIYHTEVDDSLGGQGVGKKLVAAAVNYAREHRLKIAATCPFAAKVIKENTDLSDVLAD